MFISFTLRLAVSRFNEKGEHKVPKGYLYADIVVADQAEYEKYRRLVPDTIAAYGGRYVVRGGDPEVVEGDKPDIRTVILEFESRERLAASRMVQFAEI
jgi:uncharacterized protein (DUF1330 family)